MLRFDKIWKDGITLEELQGWYDSEINKVAVPKTQYSKKVNQIDELNGNIADLEAKLENANTDEYKVKYEGLEKEFNDFKTGIETEKVNSTKTNLIKEALKSKKVNESLLNLALKGFDLDAIELEEGKIKDLDGILDNFNKENPDIIPSVSGEGFEPTNPPASHNEVADPFLAGFNL